MSYFIKEIFLDSSKFKNYDFFGTEDGTNLRNLSKVNIFVGTNNSGKSRMVRELFQAEEIVFLPNDFDINIINNLIQQYKEITLSFLESNNINGIGDVTIDNLQNIEYLEYVLSSEDFSKFFYEIIEKSINLEGKAFSFKGNYQRYVQQSVVVQELKELLTPLYNELLDTVEKGENYKFKKVYIPTLRGLRGFENSQNHYLERTKKDYFGDNNNVEIFTGLDLYEEVKKLLLGTLEDREKIAEFQEFLGISFFDGEQVTLIPSINSDVLHVKIGEEKEYPIYQLGDGIQALIALTFPLYKYKNDKLLLFIEEPELYLHPGMQRKFLEIIMSDKFEGFQYFITTHSNHLLDITLDIEQISIYSFKKELESGQLKEKNARFIIENVSNEENNVLQMLGVRNSSVFLSNCTIWVEGITDRYYIRKFLDVYQKHLGEPNKFKEDFHYAFVEYSGNNITHWSFLDDDNDEEEVFNTIAEERVCATLFLISDKDSKKKEQRQDKLVEKLGERYYCLDCKEVENVLAVDTIKKVIASYEGSNVIELNFNRDFTESTYKNKYLGTFIEEILNNKKRRGSYASKSGTISDKVGFCKRAISSINCYDDLSIEAKNLCEKLLRFISKHNS